MTFPFIPGAPTRSDGQRVRVRRGCVVGVVLLSLFAGSWVGVPRHARADETLSQLLSDVTTATAHRYGTRDTSGRSLDCLKIQQIGPGQYVGVSHTLEAGIFNVYLSTSSDLLHWTTVRQLDRNASQPTLAPDGNGGWLFADEVTKSIGGNYLRLRHFATTDALLSGTYDRQFEPPNTLAGPGGAQGTPDFSAVTLAPDIDHSVIEVGFHYFDGRDLQATATLTNFSQWSVRALPDLDSKFVGANGNVGDRDLFTYDGHPYAMHEAQLSAGDWGAWRVWVRDRRTDAVSQLAMRTHGGSVSVANPTITMLTLPDGRPGFVATDFIFGQGAARGEAGELVFYKPLPLPSQAPEPSQAPDSPPLAALTVTPSTGAASLDVSADASASTDTDETGIATYAFDFGDGSPVVGPQSTSTATHTYAAGGTYTVEVTVTDTASLSSTATSTVTVTEPAPQPSSPPPSPEPSPSPPPAPEPSPSSPPPAPEPSSSSTPPPSDIPPASALTVSPTSGVAPLAVEADASASRDGDATPIASYTFDFGDGTATAIVGPQPEDTATHTYHDAGTYTVTVTVTDTASLFSTATTSVTVAENMPPSTPADLTATPRSASRIELRWSASADDVAVSEYAIYRAPSGSVPLTKIGSTDAGHTFVDTGAAPGVAYDYYVTAVDAASNESPPSNTVTVATPALTSTFVAVADATIARGKPRTNFGRDTRLLVDSSPLHDALIRFDVTNSVCTRVTSATLRLTANDASAEGGGIYTTTAGWPEASVTWGNAPPRGPLLGELGRVSSRITYSVDVTAGVTTPNGPAGFRIGTTSSDAARYYSREGGTAAQRPQLTVTCVAGTSTDALAPTAPMNLGATSMSSTRIDLGWTASSDDVGLREYAVYRAPAGSSSFVKVGSTPGRTTFADVSVEPGSAYEYRVAAIDAAFNESSPSNTVAASTPSTGGQGQTLTFVPSADATIDQTNPSRDRRHARRLVVDDSPVRDTLLQFNVVAPGCTGITVATLRLTANDKAARGGDVHSSATRWRERTVNWRSAPVRGALIGSLGAVSPGVTYTVDVTAGVTTPNGLVGFRLGSTSADAARYYSKEGGAPAQRPRLTVSCS